MLASNIYRVGKREETRDRLQRVAVQLFAERGYEQTTVAEIAAAAGVTPMTFFRHFAAKEGVVMDDPYDPMIAGLVAEQDRTLPALTRVRLGIGAAWELMLPVENDLARVRLQLVAGETTLRARVRENNARTEEAIVAALVAQGIPRFVAAVAAAAAIGALTAALFEWALTAGEGALGDYVRGALDVLATSAPAALP